MNARKMLPAAGNTLAPAFHSRFRKDLRLLQYSFLNSPSSVALHVSSTSSSSKFGALPAVLAASATSIALRCNTLDIATCLLSSARCICASVTPSRFFAGLLAGVAFFPAGLFAAGFFVGVFETGASGAATSSASDFAFFAAGAKKDWMVRFSGAMVCDPDGAIGSGCTMPTRPVREVPSQSISNLQPAVEETV